MAAAGIACALPQLGVAAADEPGLVLQAAEWKSAGAAVRPPAPTTPATSVDDSGLALRLAWSLEVPAAISATAPVAPAIHPAPPAGQLLIAEISLNGVRKGEFTVMAQPDGDFLVAADDLKAMGVLPPYGNPVEVEGAPHHSLRALKASELRFDEAKLALFAVLPAERFPRKALDLLPGRPERVLEPNDNSVFFNYRALSIGDNAGGPRVGTLTTELGARYGNFLLQSSSGHARGGGSTQDIRYNTNVIHDDRRTLQRWVLGDFTAASGEMGAILNLGGISFSKSYQIDPYLIRQPMAGLIGNVLAPSQAEIYIDGVRVRTETLAPGQFELRNVNYYGGRRDVSVVIRDRFGREQQVVHPFYYTNENLREGLQEYSYNYGAQRQNIGTKSNDYGSGAFSAFHRYGVSDSLTIGGRGEAESGRYNLGPTAALRSDRWGVVSGGASWGRNPSGSGWAGVGRYTFEARDFNARMELRKYSPNYEIIGQTAASDRPKSDASASVSYGVPWFGTLGVGWQQRLQYQGRDERSTTLAYSRNLFGSLSFSAAVSRVAGGFGVSDSTDVFVALIYTPKPDFTANYLHDKRAARTSDIVQFGNNTPLGEGFGYRVVGERSDVGTGDSRRFSPSLQYNGPHGEYTADLTSVTTPGGSSRQLYQLGIGGGIAYVGDTLAFSRPVTDSFGIAKVGEVEGVRVYQNSQIMGRTDAKGTVFLPNLGSYIVNQVSIEDRDVPIEYAIADKELNISPPLRSGSVIRFDVRRVQVLTGRLRTTLAGAAQAVEYLDVIISVDGKEVLMPTGRGGEFYIENLKPGRHAARFDIGRRTCSFDLTVPESKEMMIDLGELNVCHIGN
ncbi:fimbria/pilus outer membrane usher protein [Sulfurisoma sediminicola]|uniref:fimbria/pilus outer membrane usher protein n=1 Tax=Sulfurisoma sediminicola TaxID=1381557 RepID=UPI000F606F61|nr:fimbria/pilus outer membrane usher protein [Sulfurisoma sediminicola]